MESLERKSSGMKKFARDGQNKQLGYKGSSGMHRLHSYAHSYANTLPKGCPRKRLATKVRTITRAKHLCRGNPRALKIFGGRWSGGAW